MTDTELLNSIIEKSGLKKGKLAQMMGISRFALLKKINNDNEFKVSEVVALCKLLGITKASDKNRIFFAQRCESNSQGGENLDA